MPKERFSEYAVVGKEFDAENMTYIFRMVPELAEGQPETTLSNYLYASVDLATGTVSAYEDGWQGYYDGYETWNVYEVIG